MLKSGRLSEKQKVILDDYFNRSLEGENMEDIAKSHGIARKTLSTWKNSDEGKRLHAEWKKEATRDAIPQYYDVLKEKALSGSYKHMELFAKVFDLLSPEKQEVVTKNETPKPSENVYTKERLDELLKELDLDDVDDQPIKRVK
jgi:transposase-like protein